MGKRIITQRRGRGTMRYRAHSFNFKGAAKHPTAPFSDEENKQGIVLDFITCAAHSAPLAVVDYGDETCLMLAPEGMRVGAEVETGATAPAEKGNVVPLGQIPEGSFIHNIEAKPGDGGKFVRASGTFARVVSRTPKGIVVKMPSKKQKVFHANCRASLGVIAGGGRIEKPLLKAGIAHFKHKARNHLYPKVSASAMNAVDHPYGNKRTARKSKAKPVSRHAPPGRKVGMVAARRTGRKKR